MRFFARLLLVGSAVIVPVLAADSTPTSTSESVSRVLKLTEGQFLSAAKRCRKSFTALLPPGLDSRMSVALPSRSNTSPVAISGSSTRSNTRLRPNTAKRAVPRRPRESRASPVSARFLRLRQQGARGDYRYQRQRNGTGSILGKQHQPYRSSCRRLAHRRPLRATHSLPSDEQHCSAFDCGIPVKGPLKSMPCLSGGSN